MHIPKDLIGGIKTFQSEAKEELLDLLHSQWYQYTLTQKQLLLMAIANRTEQELGIDPLVSVDYFTPSCDSECIFNAYYDKTENAIYFNRFLLDKEDPDMVHSVLMHELEHRFQHHLLDHWECSVDQESRFTNLAICLDDTEHPVSFCSKQEYSGQFLTMPCEQDVVKMFYALSTAEREAYKVQYDINNPVDDDNILLQGYATFRERYLCNFTDSDISNIIDTAHYNLYNHQYPDGDYETRNLIATVMYDLFHVVQHNYDSSYDLSILNDFSKKQKILADYGYTVYKKDPINDLSDQTYAYIKNLSLLDELTIEQQIVNPLLLLRCFILKQDTANHIKDKEAFIYEIEKDFYSYSEEIQSLLLDSFSEYLEVSYE